MDKTPTQKTQEWRERNPYYRKTEKYRQYNKDRMKKKRDSLIEGPSGESYRFGRVEGIKRHYGITLEELDTMLVAQNFKCYICETKLDFISKKRGNGAAAIDHCHITGEVCKVLCDLCNTAIGSLKEDPDLIQKALEYVKEFKIPKV